jgi:hypothetical protein
LSWLDTQDIVRFICGNVLAILAIRILPFAMYALLSRRVRVTGKAGTAVAYTALVCLLCSFGPGFRLQYWEICLGFAYFTGAALGFHGLRQALTRGHIGKLSVLAASAIAFQLIPALLIRGSGSATVHVLGWELMLGAYSYCVDSARSAEQPRLRDGVFFLLVNPVLVYAERGRNLETAQLDRRALGYCGLGFCGLTAQASLHVLRGRWPEGAAVDLLDASGALGYASWASFSVLQFFTFYAGMAGVANLQIGLMRALGYDVPDRFNWPFLARSPAEFWDRWNTYVASWFGRYVFVPIARNKRRFHESTAVRYTLATLVTFLAVGLAHEYALLLQYGNAHGAPTFTFVLAGLVVLGWKALSRPLRSAARRLGPAALQRGRLSPAVARAVFIPLLLVMLWLALPALSGRGFPESIERLRRTRAFTAQIP